jgi:subtilisin family serine protease
MTKPDLVAPGHRIVSIAARRSTLFATRPGARVAGTEGDEDYLRLSGTSMSAAVTSGVVALLIEAHEKAFHTPLSPNAIKAILEFSAIPLDGVDRLTQGSGALNADGAIQLARAIDPAAAPGAWWLATGVTGTTSIGGDTLPWGQTVARGNTVCGATPSTGTFLPGARRSCGATRS